MQNMQKYSRIGSLLSQELTQCRKQLLKQQFFNDHFGKKGFTCRTASWSA